MATEVAGAPVCSPGSSAALFTCSFGALVIPLDTGNLRRRAFGDALDDRAVRTLIGEFQAIRIGLDEVLQAGILGLLRLRNGIGAGRVRRASCHYARLFDECGRLRRHVLQRIRRHAARGIGNPGAIGRLLPQFQEKCEALFGSNLRLSRSR